MDIAIQLIILLVLLLLSAYFSSTETALTVVSQIKLRTIAEDKSDEKEAARAERVIKITSDKEKMLSAILIGNNVVNLSASSLATTLAVSIFGSVGAGIATGILTLLILIFGEITPKNRAQKYALEISLKRAKTIDNLMWILTPLIFIVNYLSQIFMHLMRADKDDPDDVITEEEIRTIVDVSSESGAIEENEQMYIHNLFDFSESTAREVMIPRIDVTMVDVEWSYDQLIEVFAKEKLTRMPVYEEDIDHIIGIINMKDLLIPHDADEEFSIRNYLREAYFTYEMKNLDELFSEMRHNSIAMAIVQDEYGSVTGIVTLEDLLEELVGEIRDEYDTDEEDEITQVSEREFLVRASTNLEDLCDLLPLQFESEDYDTIGGYLTGQFDHVPSKGEIYVTADGVTLRVIAVGHQRIEMIRIRFPEPVDFHDPDDPESED